MLRVPILRRATFLHPAEEAIATLNSLQSNAEVLQSIRKKRGIVAAQSLSLTEKYMNRIGIDQNDLAKLSVIHVAGTKGKGSTCAFVESILREYGFKVGLYTSPHLVVARERIRIGGQIISEEMFTTYFWDVYDKLEKEKDSDNDMPPYFRFLTVLALKVFLETNVDVAILEVGLGGEYDCTNVVQVPVVCGITSLDLDHTSILGKTIEAIAWQKAGIMKPNVTTYTIEQDSQSSYKVLENRAVEKGATLIKAPPLEDYSHLDSRLELGLNGSVQFINASLALQLAHHWMNKHFNKKIPQGTNGVAEAFSLSEEDMRGLKNVVWPGRSQVLKKDGFTYFIDGAHTKMSILACMDWFTKASVQQACLDKPLIRILLFNITGDRNPKPLLESLSMIGFDGAIFCPNLSTTHLNTNSDQKIVGVSESAQIDKCYQLKDIWDQQNDSSDKRPTKVFHCTKDAVTWVHNQFEGTPYQVQVLVTGSLHLVGAVLAVIDPALSTLNIDKPKRSMADIVKNRSLKMGPSTP